MGPATIRRAHDVGARLSGALPRFRENLQRNEGLVETLRQLATEKGAAGAMASPRLIGAIGQIGPEAHRPLDDGATVGIPQGFKRNA